MQTRLCENKESPIQYPKEQINYIKGDTQRFETSRGCPHNCPFCYEPMDRTHFSIPNITKNKVQILDMNFLYQPNIIERLNKLTNHIKVHGKVEIEAVCGVDFRLMNQDIALALRQAGFVKIRFAWDWWMKDQYRIKDCLKWFLKAGYRAEDLMCFMLVNWKITYEECCRKLDLLKVWNVRVCDCCYDGGYLTLRHNSSSPIIAIPKYWVDKEILDFRKRCRKHNQIVRFKIDPEV